MASILRPARIVRDAASCQVKAPFDPVFLDALKLAVPSVFRSWDTEARLWTVEEPYVETVVVLARKHFEVTVTDRRRRTTSSGSWAEVMLAAIPERLHRDIHKQLSKVLHPDTGGDAAAMQALNAARDGLNRKRTA